MQSTSLTALVCAALLSLSYPALAKQESDAIPPQIAQSYTSKALVNANDFMIATANPHATQAGFDILKAGGNAIDAAVAVQLMLGLVEPQSSGLGGGALMMYWDNGAKKLRAFDGRETAPQAATPTMFQDAAGKPLAFMDAVVGGKSVGTPGTIQLLEHVHQRFGQLPWNGLFNASIRLAQQGFIISPHMAEQIASSSESLQRFPTTKAYFFDNNGAPLAAGSLLTNPEYAATLKTLASQGAKGFYHGEIADEIVKTVTTASYNPGLLSIADMANYTVKEREVVCMEYRAHEVCGMGPPTSGGVAIGQILGMLGHFDLGKLGADNPDSWRLIGDATRLAFADRNLFLADSDFINVPVAQLLNTDYLEERSQALIPGERLKTVVPGDPLGNPYLTQRWGTDQALELPSTSHFVIVDKAGNVVSMTSTIENGFGSRLMTQGFLLNNELTDFSFVAEENGKPVANRIEPNKRPRSSMSPTIVLKNNQPVLAIGSPGGSNIIAYTANAIIGILDWGMDVQQAVTMPHMVNRTGDYYLEKGTSAETYKAAFEAMGYTVKIDTLNSGLQAIALTTHGLAGGADPRRDGLVLGQ